MKKGILYFILMFTTAFQLVAQDPNFSQFYNNPVYYNPGMIALNNGYSLKLNARNLWGPVPGNFSTFSASFEGAVIPKLAFAFSAYTDVAGEAKLRTTGGYMTYAYRPVETRNFMLQLGLSGGMGNKFIDWSTLRFSDDYHELYGETGNSQFKAPNYRTVFYADFGTGVSVRFNHENPRKSAYKRMMATVGFSALHLTRPKEGLMSGGNLPIKLVTTFNTAILINEFILSPALIYEVQNKFRTTTFGSSISINPLIMGLWFRNEGLFSGIYKFNSLILNFGVNVPNKNDRTFKVMYSVDFTVSQLRSAVFGAHEISLIYNWDDSYFFKNYQAKKRKIQRYQCPDGLTGF